MTAIETDASTGLVSRPISTVAAHRGARPIGLTALALMPIAVVVAVDPASWHPFGPLRWTIVSTMAIVAIGGGLRESSTITIAWRPWVALLAWMALCATVGTDPLAAWIGTNERHFGWITWALCGGLFVAAQRFGHRALALLAVSMTIGAGLLGMWSLAEMVGVAPADSGGERLTGPFGSAAMTGAAACLMTPLAIGSALDRTSSRWRRVAAGAAAVGGVVTLIGSGARAAWVGAAIAMAWAATMSWRSGRLRITRTTAGDDHRRTTAAVAIVAALGTLVALGAVMASTGVENRVTGMFDRSEPGGISRLDDWTVALSTLADRPIVGDGPEGYRTEAAAHVSAAYERRHGRVVMIDRAHSGPLDVALISGIPGLLLYGALSVIITRAIIGRYPSVERQRYGYPTAPLSRSTLIVLAASGSLIAYGAQQLLLFPLSELDPIAWVMAGALVGALANERTARTVNGPRRRWSAIVTGFVAVAALVIGTLGVVADRRAQSALDALGDLQIAEAQQRAADAADLRPDVIVLQLLASRMWSAGTSDAELRRAVGAAERASRLSSRDPAVAAEVARARSRLATTTRHPQDLTAAEEQWQFVVTLDPRNASLLVDRGRFAAEFGDAATATRFLAEAADLAPRDPAPLIDLARIALADGRRDDAVDLARSAEARSTPSRAGSDSAVRLLLDDLDLETHDR